MMNCYFCYRPLGGVYETVSLLWVVPQIDPQIDGSPYDAVVKEKAHLECLERAQRLFEDNGAELRKGKAGGAA